MRGLAIVALCVAFAVIASARPEEEKYTDEFDGIDLDEILNSKRLYDNYLHCFKTGEKCTPAGKKLRELFPDALKRKCAPCTETQKTQSKKVLRFLLKNKVEDFKELEIQFDPEHIYRTEYAEELKKEGIVLPD